MVGQESGALRRANTAIVVDELRRGGATSRAHLARRTGLAKQTVSTIVSSLLAAGVVRELGLAPAEAGGGRPAVVVEYAADRAHVLGIELGVGRTRIVLADALGDPVATRDLPGPRPRRRGPTPQAVLAEVVGIGVELLAGLEGADGERARGGARLLAVGISLTGLVRPATGSCVLAPNLGWRDVPVADLVRSSLLSRGHDVPVVVRGAAQASLIAEQREGAARGVDDVVLLFDDEGIGAAVVEGGRLLDGHDGTAGELGHCPWPEADERCGCGRRGCVETLASGPAVRRAVERATGRRISRRPGEPTLAALARRDDPAVTAAAAEAGRVLGTAASWLVALTAPRTVVLSGALAVAPASLRETLRRTLADRALGEPAELVVGALGDGASARGAVLLAVDEARRIAPH